MRQAERTGRLTAERRVLLSAIPGWVWDSRAAKWEEGYSRMLAYVARHGYARVPTTYEDADGYRLGWWGVLQRSMHSQGTLPDDRRQRLEELPGWTWKPPRGPAGRNQ